MIPGAVAYQIALKLSAPLLLLQHCQHQANALSDSRYVLVERRYDMDARQKRFQTKLRSTMNIQ